MDISDLPVWLVKILDAILIFLTNVLVALGLTPSETNILILIVVIVLILMGLLVLFSGGATPSAKKRRGTSASATFQPNPTNGMVVVMADYPFVFRLDKKGEPLGWWVKHETGPEALLRLGDRCWDVRILKKLTEKQIAEIEAGLNKDLQTGVITSGKFSFQGLEREVREAVTLKVVVVTGNPGYFPGGEGAIDYLFAASNEEGVSPEEESLLLLENPYIPHKPSKLRTWTASDLVPISVEAFESLTKEAFAKVEAKKKSRR
ncbi:hypothetical protein A2V61_00525 [Candidatus Woesebacteria bacterium RBG_19FT_COMBO_47_8]|uniref:Uncharacterized protein n=1 Tax=Candidatus Woesebacteria bacterium RBG_13_46_13 TaxID=1802479 RepID=A0A1F7X4Z3_9BACT|nr:MAG: hypothetical protein A2Y68_01685 [Candidatus Woesebacteria bacterium RBG_13_46_13]OGM18299.1 MAG: hypothetical protein A2V61_00525 [Candidatus Woesebacteria bacterium RBG_19FT_COMBO_47_8]